MKKLLIISLLLLNISVYSQHENIIPVPRTVFEYHFERSEQLTLTERINAKKDSIIKVLIYNEYNFKTIIKSYANDSIQYNKVINNQRKQFKIVEEENTILTRQNKLLKVVNKVSGGSTILMIVVILVLL